MTAAKVSRTVAPDDDMYASGPDWYFEVGQSGLKNIKDAIGDRPVTSILDIPSGYGRVLRYLRAEWATADIVACDLNNKAVDFCAKEFDAIPLYSSTDFSEIKLDQTFDLIWCGSLLTHFDKRIWTDFFDFVIPRIRDKGTLVFTTHGRIAAHLAEQHNPVYGLTEGQFRILVSDYQAEGFSYVNYSDDYPTYGISLTSASWVMRFLEKFPTFKVTLFKEQGWGHQDVYAFHKAW